MKNRVCFALTIVILCLLYLPGNLVAQADCSLLATAYPRGTVFGNQGKVLIASSKSSVFRYTSYSISDVLSEDKTQPKCRILEFKLNTHLENEALKELNVIDFDFESISTKFLFDKSEDQVFTILADGKEVLRTTLRQKWRDRISKTILRENLTSEITLDPSQLEKLASAENISLKLGMQTFNLTGDNLTSIRDFYKVVEKAKSSENN